MDEEAPVTVVSEIEVEPIDARGTLANVLLGGFVVLPAIGAGFIGGVGPALVVGGVTCGLTALVLGYE
jgi:hypothetical protein